jgi:recombination protein RecT
MTETVAGAVAKRENTPHAMIATYSQDFASVLPTHVRPDTWVRLAQGALKKGKRIADKKDPNYNKFELEVAALNNPGVFLASLLDAARLGLEPGTEQYYLTPRRVKGHLEILGIVGYQGHIELMYRAGAIASIIAEVVYANDKFSYAPGRDDVPQHDIDWDSPDRGPIRLVYAYARMKDGATSRVVVLNGADIARIKVSSQGSESEYSPWKTHVAAMWLKSAVRQLQKWVPTSAEFRREELRAKAEAERISVDRELPPAPAEAEFVDGEVIEQEWPEAAVPPDAA